MKILLGNCGLCTPGVAIPFCGITLCCGRVSSRPTGGDSEVGAVCSSVDLFVPAARRCAVHFSTTSRSRAEEDEDQHQYQHHRFPNNENTQRFPITARNTTDSEKDGHQKVGVPEDAGSRIKLMKELMLSALLPFLFYEGWMAVYLGPFAFPCGALSNCRIGCLLSAERTPLFRGCWAPLRRWCRFITARFWLSSCGQLLLQSLLLSPLLTDMSYYHLSYHLAIPFCG